MQKTSDELLYKTTLGEENKKIQKDSNDKYSGASQDLEGTFSHEGMRKSKY
jgi:hypothetical protein